MVCLFDNDYINSILTIVAGILPFLYFHRASYKLCHIFVPFFSITEQTNVGTWWTNSSGKVRNLRLLLSRGHEHITI